MQTLREQLEGRCIHFRSIEHDTCKAGVDYKLVSKPLPCFKRNGVCATDCDKREFPSPAAVDAELAIYAKHDEELKLLLPLLASIRKEHKNRYWRGILVCPLCKGKLHVEHRSSNGHTTGKCETPNCYNWIE